MRNTLSFAVVSRVVLNISGVLVAFTGLRLYNLYLTKEVYGTVLIANQFLNYLPLLSGGFGMVLGQRMLAARERETMEKNARLFQVLQTHVFVIAFLIGLVVMAVYSQMPAARSTQLPPSLFYGILVASVVTLYAGGQIGILVSMGRQIDTIILSGIWAPLGLLLLWTGFRFHLGVWSMPISSCLSAILLLPIAWIMQRRVIRGLPILTWRREADFWPTMVELWAPSIAWLESRISILLMFTLDIIFMGLMFGPGTAAVYGTLCRITALSRQLIQSLCEAATPKLTQEHDPVRKAELMKKVDRMNAWISGSWYGAMVATIHPFLSWLMSMKAGWTAGPVMIALVIARTMIISMSVPHSYGLISASRYRDIARACQRELFLMVVLMFAFGHFFGVIGGPIGVLFSTWGASLWYLSYQYFRPTQTPWLGELWAVHVRGWSSAALAAAVASGAWRLESSIAGIPGWMAMFAGGAGFAAAMGVAYVYALKQSGGQTRTIGIGLKLPVYW